MRSKTGFLESVVLVLVVTIAIVGITAGAAFAHISEFTIDEDATLAPGGLQVVVTGTLQCTAGETANVSVTVSQDRGQQTATGFGFANIACDGSVQSWGATVSTSSPFKNGPAGAVAFASSSGADGMDSGSTSNRVHLH
jgi:Family of unknown function (DUF6299)